MNVADASTAHALRSLRLLLEAYASSGELPQWEAAAAQIRVVRLEPGAVLFRAGEAHPYVYFVQRGLLKSQMKVDGGRRLATVFFSEEGEIMASLPALSMDGAQRALARSLHPRTRTLNVAAEAQSIYTMTALEPCLLLRLPFATINQLAAKHAAWARLIATVSGLHATTLQMDVAWLRGTPEQRYRDLLAEQPGLIDRVTQRDLANFLNITSVALSRIAKRVRDESEIMPDAEVADGTGLSVEARHSTA
jgi:CRP-like cAMP-binding protein